jgi:hypothetical protein
MGHCEDTWTNEKFQELLIGGVAWAAGEAVAEVPPNIERVAPRAWRLAPKKATKRKRARKEVRK